jgi:hypothetical protein
MASKKTLNAKNLEALGAQRLAELLVEISAGDAAAKRRLRLELAGAESPAEVAKEVRKRLTTIGQSRSFVDWQNRRALVDDLETQRRASFDASDRLSEHQRTHRLTDYMAGPGLEQIEGIHLVNHMILN